MIFILAFETTVLIKLWYWMVNTKLGILREVKLLRLDLAAQKGSLVALETIASVESPTKAPGVHKRERAIWFGALIAVGVFFRHRHRQASGSALPGNGATDLGTNDHPWPGRKCASRCDL